MDYIMVDTDSLQHVLNDSAFFFSKYTQIKISNIMLICLAYISINYNRQKVHNDSLKQFNKFLKETRNNKKLCCCRTTTQCVLPIITTKVTFKLIQWAIHDFLLVFY